MNEREYRLWYTAKLNAEQAKRQQLFRLRQTVIFCVMVALIVAGLVFG
jgi:hypothetical protein